MRILRLNHLANLKKEFYTLDNTSVDVIDRTIDSMSGRINAVIKSKGFRIKY